jgi:hypothetical protein
MLDRFLTLRIFLAIEIGNGPGHLVPLKSFMDVIEMEYGDNPVITSPTSIPH